MAYYKRDMLSINTRNMISNYLADLTLVVDSIEQFRIALAQLPDFDGISLFRFLDREEKGYLSVSNFQWLITDSSKKLIHYAFSWFDVAKVGQVTRLQFIDFLLTKQNPVLRQRVQLNLQQAKLAQYIPESLRYQLDTITSLILEIIKKEIKLIPMRRKIMVQDDYSIQAVMNSLDNDKKGYITANDLFKFMKNYGIDVRHSHMKELLVNYDHDLNGKISLNQLTWIIQGFENKQSQYRKIIRTGIKQLNKKVKTEVQEPIKQQEQKLQGKKNMTTGKKKRKNKENITKKQQQKNISQFKDQKTRKTFNKKLELEKKPNLPKNYQILKKSFQLMAQEVEEIDKSLIQFDKQLQIKALKQFEAQMRQLQVKRMMHQQQIIRRQEEEAIRREQQRAALLALKIEEQQFEKKAILLRQQQIYAEQEQTLKQIRYQVDKEWNAEQRRAQLLMSRRNQNYFEARSYQGSARQRLKSFQDRRDIYEKSAAKINKYLVHEDPLGIKEHLAETQKYLIRSRQLRERIKEQRAAQHKIHDYIKCKQLPGRSSSVHNSLLKLSKQKLADSISRRHFNSTLKYQHTAATNKNI